MAEGSLGAVGQPRERQRERKKQAEEMKQRKAAFKELQSTFK